MNIPSMNEEPLYIFNCEIWEEVVEDRPNRFVVITKRGKRCHVHDPGRLKELIYPGNRVLVRAKKGKKTDCWVTAAWADGIWVLTDSSVHNDIARKFLPSNARAEVKLGDSRFDFAFDDTFVEVKGCSLVKDGKALFPDAVTERGRRHMLELAELTKQGKKAIVLVLVTRPDADCFSPNFETDPKFSEAFIEALKSGVKVIVKKLELRGNAVYYAGDLPLCREVVERISTPSRA